MSLSSIKYFVIYLVVSIPLVVYGLGTDTSAKSVRMIVEEFYPGEQIRGEIAGIHTSLCNRYSVVVYVRTDKWYIHPFAAGGDGRSYGAVDPLCRWSIATVSRYPLPRELAVLLVDKGFDSPSTVFSLEQIPYHAIAIREWNEDVDSTGVLRAEILQGVEGESTRWGAGWLDLVVPKDFRGGDKIRLTIGGSAARIIVRFLPAGADPNNPAGFEGGILEVPDSRVVEVTLSQDHRNVVQISVHGGPNPWGRFPLGGSNGPASLLLVELFKK